jgi:putative ABC transport system permease protein
VLGTALAWAMIRGLLAIAPERLPGMDTVALDGRVLAFTLACAASTGILFGIVPALIAGRAGATALVRSGAGQTGRGTRRTQQTLIAVQLALSMVLLVEAALFARSLGKLSAVDPGFRAGGLTTVLISLPRRYSDEQTFALTNDMLQRLSAHPGVERVTAATRVPFVGGTSSSPITIDRPNAATESRPRNTLQRYVLPDYFDVMGIRLIAGRAFNGDDREGGELVAIVSAAEVMRDFPGESPLGRLVKHQGKWRRIVGVVADVKYRGLGRDDEATIYVPYGQYIDGWPMFMIRGPAASAIGPAFKAMLREVESRATLTEVVSVSEAIGKSYAAERYRTVLVSAFGVMAALLAAVGLYGVSVRSASRRTREIGIRLALGGTGATVLRLLVVDAMRGVLIGLVFGVPAALLVGRGVAPYLFKVSPNDPLSFAVVSLVLVLATAIASVVPARVAGRSSPAVVLRAE